MQITSKIEIERATRIDQLFMHASFAQLQDLKTETKLPLTVPFVLFPNDHLL